MALLFLALIMVAKGLSALEKFVRRRSQSEVVRQLQSSSLLVFKVTRTVVFALAAVEATLSGSWTETGFVTGFVALFFGMALRLSAIHALGPLWSYHVQAYRNHWRIEDGVYRYLRHPAYFGNIHIPGILLMVGAPVSSIVALIGVGLFYFVRSRAEEELLSQLKAT